MTANITRRNMALNRCIPVEMIASEPTPVPAALHPPVRVPHWGGFSGYRGIPLMLCRLRATNLITRTHGSSPLWLGEATSRVSFVEHRLSRRRRKRKSSNLPERRSAQMVAIGRSGQAAVPSVRPSVRPSCKISATEREERRRGAEVGR